MVPRARTGNKLRVVEQRSVRERRAIVPVIQCDIREGRTEEQKQALAREITRIVHETIGSPVEYIYVLIRETPGAHHVKGGESLPDWEPHAR